MPWSSLRYMRNVAMSDEEIDEFLSENNTLRLATVSENGWPHVVPLAYARLDESDSLFVLTHPDQRKSRNLFYDNRLGAVIDDGEQYPDLRGVFFHGRATIVSREEKMKRLERAWIDQCYDGELPPIVKQVYSRRDGWVWFEITPVHRVSWDNTKLDPEKLVDDQDLPDSPFDYAVPEDAGAAEPPSSEQADQ